MSRKTLTTLQFALGFTLFVGVGIGVNLLTDSSTWVQVAISLTAAIFAATAAIPALMAARSASLARTAIDRARTEHQRLVDLLETEQRYMNEADTLRATSVVDAASGIEHLASACLIRIRGELPVGIHQIRAGMNEAGIWSADDLGKFDQVMTVRNAIVHGDRTATNHQDTELAMRYVLSLLTSLQRYEQKTMSSPPADSKDDAA